MQIIFKKQMFAEANYNINIYKYCLRIRLSASNKLCSRSMISYCIHHNKYSGDSERPAAEDPANLCGKPVNYSAKWAATEVANIRLLSHLHARAAMRGILTRRHLRDEQVRLPFKRNIPHSFKLHFAGSSACNGRSG